MKILKRFKRNFKIWFIIEIKPGVINYLEKRSFTIKRWRYINNVPSIKELIEELKDNHDSQKQVDTYTYFNGVVRTVPLIEWSKGKPVMTPIGVGRVKVVITDNYFSNGVTKVIVEIMTTNFRKSRGYIKYFKPSELTQMVVYHEPSSQFILLSPKDYVYIADENESITYRITKRKYATLSPDYKAATEDVKIFNDYKNGALILRRLHANGFVVVKEICNC